jgi:hypothetical protein
MLDCRRCGNSGRVTERYFEPATPSAPIGPRVPIKAMTMELLTRVVECPDCLGFSNVPRSIKQRMG